jgi:hypothetical protein
VITRAPEVDLLRIVVHSTDRAGARLGAAAHRALQTIAAIRTLYGEAKFGLSVGCQNGVTPGSWKTKRAIIDARTGGRADDHTAVG